MKKLKNLLSEYKKLYREYNDAASTYNYICANICQNDEQFYEEQCKSLKYLDGLKRELRKKLQNIFCEYRTICESPKCKIAFALHLMPYQKKFKDSKFPLFF